MGASTAQDGISSTPLHGALLEFYRAPGKHQLTLRQPPLLFASIRDILQLAAGRGALPDAGPQESTTLREAAAFFIRAALLYPGADHYAVLGLSARQEPVELKERYRLLMRLIHPDFAASGEASWPADAAVRVNRAYEVLSSPVLRRDYDQYLANLQTPRPPRAEARRGADPAWRRPQLSPALRRTIWAVGLCGALLTIGILLPRSEPVQLVQKNAAPATERQASPAPQAPAAPPPLPQPQPTQAAAPVQPPAATATRPHAAPELSPRLLEAQPAAPAATEPGLAAPRAVVAAVAPDRGPAHAAPHAAVAPAAAAAAAPVRSLAPAPAAVSQAPAPAADPVVPPSVGLGHGIPAAPAQAALASPGDARPPTAAAPPSPAPVAPSSVAASAGVVATAASASASAAAPSLLDAQPLLTQLLQTMESGSGEQLLQLLEPEAREAAAARALSSHYDRLVQGARPVRLAHVEFQGESRPGLLLVTGRIRLHAGEPTIGALGEKLLLRAEFVSRGGKVHLNGLGGGAE